MLTLPIKKEWFDLIRAEIKKEEYREVSQYYNSRLMKFLGKEFEVKLRNGYRADSPYIICKCKCHISFAGGRPEWGAVPNKMCYVLTILEILETKE